MWVEEASDVVDGAVSVVAGNPLVKPENFPHSKVGVEHSFQLFFRDSRITGLERREQTFFSSQQGSSAIDVNASAFQYDPLLAFSRPGRGLPLARLQSAGKPIDHSIVELIVVVLRPAVELPVCDCDFTVAALHEN